MDPVYTGKLFFGIFDLISRDYFKPKSKILIIHTGGLQGIQNNLILILISFQSYSQSNIQIYIQQYQDIAVNHMHEYGIPASIKLAQGILESSYGTSKLAKESNNHFGIKCHKDWAGAVVYHDDDEKDECFRKYDFVEDSYLDHSLFLVNKERYSSLFELKKMTTRIGLKD